MAEAIFWCSLVFILYTYFGYPLTLWVTLKIAAVPILKSYQKDLPFVSIVIAARNEESRIKKRILNLADQDYPSDLLEIIVVSDGSIDGTELELDDLKISSPELLKNLKVLRLARSSGKASALNLGLRIAKGEVIVFADVRQTFAKNAVSELVANFSDENIGGVSGELLFIDENSSTVKHEMGVYWNYEKFIRKAESGTGSVIGATGAIYAIRQNIFMELPANTILDDVLTPLNIVGQGKRIVFDGKAVAYDSFSRGVDQEWNRKVRTLAGNWQLFFTPGVVRKAISKGYFFRLFWHKMARVIVPFMLVALYFSSLCIESVFYTSSVLLQSLFYGTVIVSNSIKQYQDNRIIKVARFFCILNIAALVGFYIWFSGKSSYIWKSEIPGGQGR